MQAKIKYTPIRYVLTIYLLCFIFRAIEYLFIRTDQSIIGEAIIHKLLGIVVLGIAVWCLQYHWRSVGFAANSALRGIALGLGLGCGVMFLGYGVELLLLSNGGEAFSLRFYPTSYAVQGNRALQDGLWFVVLCIVGNIINVVMEEGIFRGLFMRMIEEKHTFLKACIVSSILFGLWHIAQPIRNLLDGEQSLVGAAMTALLLVGTSALGGIQYCMLVKITGSLWAGMAAHFVNNTSVNLLHVVTITGVDEMQAIRITIAQTLSFITVLVIFIVRKAYKNQTFHQ